MNPAFLSAFAILGGSALGGAMSLASSWLTQHSQARAERIAQRKTRLEALYGEFIDEAARLYAHALVHDAPDPSEFVGLYVKIGKMRFLSSSSTVVSSAEAVASTIIETYDAPNKTLPELRNEANLRGIDPLRGFSAACRVELQDRSLDSGRAATPAFVAARQTPFRA